MKSRGRKKELHFPNGALGRGKPERVVPSLLRLSYDFLASLQFGLFLVVIIGLSAAVGSAFQEDFYRSSWFATLLSALFLNLLLCTLKRGSTYLRTRCFGLKQIGVFVLHAGLLFVLAGGFITVAKGERARVPLAEGGEVSLGRFLRAGQDLKLRLEDFAISYHPDGTPAQFTARLALEDRSTTIRGVAAVNHPFYYRGMKFYQYSYRWRVRIEVRSASGVRQVEVEEGDILPVEEAGLHLKVYRYLPNFSPEWGMESKGVRPDNPRLLFSVYRGEERLGVGIAAPGEDVALDGGVSVVFTGVRPVAVLLVKTDPGQPLVLTGGLVFAGGVLMILSSTFYRRTRIQHDEEEGS
ncbi:MAG: Cytochrome c biogenesis protein ResB [Thermoanaerobacterales bacterium 50_218]|nr:MAG: Cytochrome c biogenesis protein ResB [Thermoanaerobacterales bacterium 50_218]HAA89598.1 hypothetical protein [Peptococcaceae bacterium]